MEAAENMFRRLAGHDRPPQTSFDLVFVGHYTKDTIVHRGKTHTQNGGAYYFGAHVAARMGLKVAVVTRLAEEDRQSFEPLQELGVTVLPTFTPESTLLRLEYPSDNLDERILYTTGNAGPFTVEEVRIVRSRSFHVGASMRGEVPAEVVQDLKARSERVSLDAQGYVRVNRDGVLTFDDWPGKEEVLQHVNVLKADSVEAERLTGTNDLRHAARTIAGWGPSEVILTHGDGVLAFAEGRFYEAPFVTERVRGRSGRGDTCTAAYMAKRLTAPPEEAAVWAAAVTSLKLEREGPFDRDIEEVERLIRSRYRR